MKLDLGSGYHPRPGYEGVDLFAATTHTVNLFSFPWPWEDSSVDALHSSHFLEHIPTSYITPDNREVPSPTSAQDKDLLCRFMDEAWRILKPGGEFTIVVPSARSNRAFQDPTHRRFFVAESFNYFNKTWRTSVALDHYLCSCDFEVHVNPIVPNELLSQPHHVQEVRYRHEWNTTLDWNAKLVCVK
jgi:predicted SAM-dependent methyltransferase